MAYDDAVPIEERRQIALAALENGPRSERRLRFAAQARFGRPVNFGEEFPSVFELEKDSDPETIVYAIELLSHARELHLSLWTSAKEEWLSRARSEETSVADLPKEVPAPEMNSEGQGIVLEFVPKRVAAG